MAVKKFCVSTVLRVLVMVSASARRGSCRAARSGRASSCSLSLPVSDGFAERPGYTSNDILNCINLTRIAGASVTANGNTIKSST